MFVEGKEREQAARLAVQRVAVFERRYGVETLWLAAHGAFPLALTADLVYCLRESFAELAVVPWYGAADLLLSGLCRSIGHDLYEMPGAVRLELLGRLQRRFGAVRIRELEAWMTDYIVVRLRLEEQQAVALGQVSRERSRILGDRPHWTTLCCLSPGEARRRIEQELRSIALDSPERLHLAAMVESYGGLLPGEPIFLRWAEQLAENVPIAGSDEGDWDGRAWAREQGVELRSREVETARIYRGQRPLELQLDPNLERSFEFKVVTVDPKGKVIKEETKSSRYFVEPLGVGVPPLELVAIPGGKFRMGASRKEAEIYEDERPQHWVQVPPFFIGKYAVTQAQWRYVAGLGVQERELDPDPAGFKGDNRPVERISWDDAQEFCRRVSMLGNRQCRLPSEAEWEYACRAGTTTPFHFGPTISPELANYDGNYVYGQGVQGIDRSETTDVGSFGVANAFGLYDMHGNMWEWCEDDWHDDYQGAPQDGSAWTFANNQENRFKILRGGSWFSYPRYCRSACRLNDRMDYLSYDRGFRVVYSSAKTLL